MITSENLKKLFPALKDYYLDWIDPLNKEIHNSEDEVMPFLRTGDRNLDQEIIKAFFNNCKEALTKRINGEIIINEMDEKNLLQVKYALDNYGDLSTKLKELIVEVQKKLRELQKVQIPTELHEQPGRGPYAGTGSGPYAGYQRKGRGPYADTGSAKYGSPTTGYSPHSNNDERKAGASCYEERLTWNHKQRILQQTGRHTQETAPGMRTAKELKDALEKFLAEKKLGEDTKNLLIEIFEKFREDTNSSNKKIKELVYSNINSSEVGETDKLKRALRELNNLLEEQGLSRG